MYFCIGLVHVLVEIEPSLSLFFLIVFKEMKLLDRLEFFFAPVVFFLAVAYKLSSAGNYMFDVLSTIALCFVALVYGYSIYFGRNNQRDLPQEVEGMSHRFQPLAKMAVALLVVGLLFYLQKWAGGRLMYGFGMFACVLWSFILFLLYKKEQNRQSLKVLYLLIFYIAVAVLVQIVPCWMN